MLSKHEAVAVGRLEREPPVVRVVAKVPVLIDDADRVVST
jgi:hypothetical protein